MPVSVTRKFNALVRVAETQFRSLNRNKSLSTFDKKQLKTFFLDRMIGPRVRDVLQENRIGRSSKARLPQDRMAGQSLLTAKEVEAWLKIDVKTLYAFAQRKIIPHVRLKGNVRFPAREIKQWVDRHSHLPAAMAVASRTRAKRPSPGRTR